LDFSDHGVRMTSMDLYCCLEEWADDGTGRKMLGILKDDAGELVHDENGPVRVLVENDRKYNTYEEFHGSEEWREILWKLSESGLQLSKSRSYR